jgi:hypothetical protein
MARYDRIARLGSPERDKVFTGWLMLRDLESRERDPDLGRRARVRFLAVRLLHRLVDREGAIDPDSLQQQVNAVREELGMLPSRDPDRELLAELLEQLASNEVDSGIRSALKMARTAETGGHPFAAEEWTRAALRLARANGLEHLAAEASGDLARLDGASRA